MGSVDPRGLFAMLKRWYRHASAWAPKPSRTDMEKFRGYFQTLYQMEEPHTPGLPLATHVNLSKVENEVPLEAEVEAEVEAVVQLLCPHMAVGHTHLRAKHFKQ